MKDLKANQENSANEENNQSSESSPKKNTSPRVSLVSMFPSCKIESLALGNPFNQGPKPGKA